MFRNMLRSVPLAGTLLAIVTVTPVSGQFYPGGNACGCSASPIQAAPQAACAPAQPVFQTCYQTVPVTEYQREERTVQRPIVETAYEDREVTVQRPVSEVRYTEVPTVNYQTVTDYKTVNRDMGRWVTQYHPNQRCSPCEYDRRPGMLGWMNRTGYSMRSAFTPKYSTTRHYCPNVVTQTVPVNRTVAIRGTKQVAYNVTRMVASRETQRVAVPRVTYRSEKVTVMKPVTAYRTVPIGTSIAYAPSGGSAVAFNPYGNSYALGGSNAFAYGLPAFDDNRTALEPRDDPQFSRRRLPAETRSADRDLLHDELDDPRTGRFDRVAPRSSSKEIPAKKSSFHREVTPQDPYEPAADLFDDLQGSRSNYRPVDSDTVSSGSRRTSSSNSGWKAYRTSPRDRSDGPRMAGASNVSVVWARDRQ